LLIGWGADAETKKPYWIVRNSYGPKWGKNGDFMLVRGTNAFGVESDAVSVIPTLCGENSKESCEIV
jgi:hypothetical protein